MRTHTKTSFGQGRRWLSLLLAAMMLTTLVSCGGKSNEKLIEERLTTFATAYNGGDMQGVLSCFNMETRNACQAMINLLGGLASAGTGLGIELNDLFALGVSMAPGDFMGLKINEIVVEKDGKRATAATTMKLVDEDEDQTVYFIMVYENDGWYIEDMSLQANIGSSQTGVNVNVLSAHEVDDGFSVINKFQMNSQAYCGVINAEGEIIYATPVGESFVWKSAGNGCGFVMLEPDVGRMYYSYIVFDSDGKKTFTVNGDVFDLIIGCGDGLLFVYKDTSTIEKEEHSYGVLDCNGNWITPLTAGPELILPESKREFYKYVGDGAFMSDGNLNTYNKRYRNILYNSHTNCAYLINSDYGYITSYPEEEGAEKTDLPRKYIINPDGTAEAMPETAIDVRDNLVWMGTDTGIQILDRETGITREYTEFPIDMIRAVKYDSDSETFTVIIQGVDGKVYFTVIDKECNQKFDPIVSYPTGWNGIYYIYPGSNGRIAYCDESGVYKVIDTDGNVIVPNTQGFTSIGAYSGGMALASKDQSCFFLDVNGQVLDIKLPN